MKKIKIDYVGFGENWDKNRNFITNILNEKYSVEISNDPEYIFFQNEEFNYISFDGIRIFYTGENIVPNFNFFDYGMAHNYIEFEDRYQRVPYYYRDNVYSDMQLMKVKHQNPLDTIKEKKFFCNYIYSNDFCADSCRSQFFFMLNDVKHVDSGGGSYNNIGYKVKNKLEWQREYKFSIAFENSSVRGYTTEKIVQAFAAKTIPIYWGDPLINREFNTKAFINCNDYLSFDEVIEKVMEIDSNDELYMDIMSEPAVITNNISNNYIKFKNFLYNIFDQEYRDAFRRPLTGWNKIVNQPIEETLYKNYIKNNAKKMIKEGTLGGDFLVECINEKMKYVMENMRRNK